MMLLCIFILKKVIMEVFTMIKYIHYLPICSYDNKEYYLFHCNNKFEVIADYLFDSIEECMNMTNRSKKEIVWIKNNCNEIY